MGGKLSRISDHVYVCLGEGGRTNATFLVDSRSGQAVVVDTLATPSLIQAAWEEVQAATGAHLRYIINTHYHGDHVLGNSAFVDTPIIGHRSTAETMRRLGSGLAAGLIHSMPDLADEIAAAPIVAPDLLFQGRLELQIGDMTAEVIHIGHAHTPSDTVIWLPKDRVLVAADTVFCGVLPVLRDANLRGWINVLDLLERFDAVHVVPGHGPLAEPDDLLALQALLRSCLDLGEAELQTGHELDWEAELPAYRSWLRQERWPQLRTCTIRELALQPS